MASETQIAIKSELAAQYTLLQGMTNKQAAEALDMSEPGLYRLMATPEFKTLREKIRSQVSGARENFVEELSARLRQLADQAVYRLEDILFDSANESVVLRASETVLDRVGLRPEQKVEHKIIHTLDAESLELLKIAETEIELDRSDWSYGYERPTISRAARLESARRADAGAVAADGSPEHVFLREGDSGVQGSGSGPARGDGEVETKAIKQETGSRPTGSPEDVIVDHSGQFEVRNTGLKSKGLDSQRDSHEHSSLHGKDQIDSGEKRPI